jgi:WD40 repeat protein
MRTRGKQFANWRSGGAVLCVAFSPDGKQIANGSLDGTIRIWDVGTGLANEIINTNRQQCKSVAWSPNGSLLATLLHFSPLISLWDVQKRQTILSISTHQPALDVAFSPHGVTIASASEDGTLGCVRTCSREGRVESSHTRPPGTCWSCIIDCVFRGWEATCRRVSGQNGSHLDREPDLHPLPQTIVRG